MSSALHFHVSWLHPCFHSFIQMSQTCLCCPFSFGYPSEQSLWTAYPFTAINNSLPLPLPYTQHLTRLLPSSTTTTITPPLTHLLLVGLGLYSPSLSLSHYHLHGPFAPPQQLQLITWQARMSPPQFFSSHSTPHIHESQVSFRPISQQVDHSVSNPIFRTGSSTGTPIGQKHNWH